MNALNLSDWALKHRSFIVFIMIAVTLAGVASFFSLGRAEDPPFGSPETSNPAPAE